jgi:hypothetical protein
MDRELQRNSFLFTGAMILLSLFLSIGLGGMEGMLALIACAIFNHTLNQILHK